MTVVRCQMSALNSSLYQSLDQWLAIQAQPPVPHIAPHRYPKDDRSMDIYSPNMQREALLKFAKALAAGAVRS